MFGDKKYEERKFFSFLFFSFHISSIATIDFPAKTATHIRESKAKGENVSRIRLRIEDRDYSLYRGIFKSINTLKYEKIFVCIFGFSIFLKYYHKCTVVTVQCMDIKH